MRVLGLLLILALSQGLLGNPFELGEMEEETANMPSAQESVSSDEGEDNASTRDSIVTGNDDEDEDDEKDQIKESESPTRRTVTMSMVQKTLRFPNGVRFHQNEMCLFKDQKGMYVRGEITSLTGSKVSLKLPGGSVVHISTRTINKLTPDKVPSGCQIYRGSKCLVVDGDKYYPGVITAFYYSVQFDGESTPRWFPISAIRHLNPGMCAVSVARKRIPVIKQRRILVRDDKGVSWKACYLQGRLPNHKILFREVRYPHAKGVAYNTGNRIIPAIFADSRDVHVGDRVLVDKVGKGYDYFPGTVVKSGYIVTYRQPTGRIVRDLMYIEDLRLRPAQPWFIKEREKPEVIEKEGIDEVTKGQRIITKFDNSALPAFIIDVKRVRGKIYRYNIKIDFNNERPYFEIKDPQPGTKVYVRKRGTNVWIKSTVVKLLTSKKIYEVKVLPGTPVHKGYLREPYKDDFNKIVVDEPMEPGNAFPTLRGIAKVPGGKRKEWFPGTINFVDKKKKVISFVYDNGAVATLPLKYFRVFPQQDETVITKLIKYIKRRKYIWLFVQGKRYKAIIDTFGKGFKYVVVHIVITKKEITDCTKLVDLADKYLKSLRRGNRLWAQVGCDYYRGTVVKRMPTISRRNSYNKLTVKFRLFGRRAIQKIDYGPLKVSIKGRYYWGEVVKKKRDGKGFLLTLTARAHRIPRGLRERMREIQKETQRRLRELFKKGFRLWAKIRGSWTVSDRRIVRRPSLISQIVTFKVKRGALRTGRRVRVRIGKISLPCRCTRVQGRRAFIKCKVPQAVINQAMRGKKKNIEKESIKENRKAPVPPYLYGWRTTKGFRFKRIFQAGATAVVEFHGQGVVFTRCRILSIRSKNLVCKLLKHGAMTKVVTITLRDPMKALSDMPPVEKYLVRSADILYEIHPHNDRTGTFYKGKVQRRRQNGHYDIKLLRAIRNRFNGRMTKYVHNVKVERLRYFSLQYPSHYLRKAFNHRSKVYSRQFARLIIIGRYCRANGKKFKRYYSYKRVTNKVRKISRRIMRRVKGRTLLAGLRNRMRGRRNYRRGRGRVQKVLRKIARFGRVQRRARGGKRVVVRARGIRRRRGQRRVSRRMAKLAARRHGRSRSQQRKLGERRRIGGLRALRRFRLLQRKRLTSARTSRRLSSRGRAMSGGRLGGSHRGVLRRVGGGGGGGRGGGGRGGGGRRSRRFRRFGGRSSLTRTQGGHSRSKSEFDLSKFRL